MRKESEREQKADDEANEVSVVVDPREKPNDEKENEEDDEFSNRPPRVLQHLPALDHFHEQTRQQTELRTCWTGLVEKTALLAVKDKGKNDNDKEIKVKI